MRLVKLSVVLASALILFACAAAEKNKEDMLTASGFRVELPNTPARVASLQALPPHKFSMQNRNGKVVWIYADPTICQCLYLGDQAAYDTYRRGLADKRMADQARVVQWLNENNAVPYPFPWEEWGPGTAYYY